MRCAGCIDALRVKTRGKKEILALPEVHGIGVNHRKHTVMIYCSPKAAIPRHLSGIQTERYYTHRPRIFGGRYAGGDGAATFSHVLGRPINGTIGLTLEDGYGNPFLLSANHTFAGIDTVEHPTAEAGQVITRWDSDETIATLLEWIALSETRPNIVDAAIAEPLNPEDAGGEIRGIGTPVAAGEAYPGLKVMKMGAATGLTKSRILDTHASFKVNYEGLFDLEFDDQLMIEGGSFSRTGDSGAAVVTTHNDNVVVVGLLYAGSETISMANRLDNVARGFGFSFPSYPLERPEDLLRPAGLGIAAMAAGFGLILRKV